MSPGGRGPVPGAPESSLGKHPPCPVAAMGTGGHVGDGGPVGHSHHALAWGPGAAAAEQGLTLRKHLAAFRGAGLPVQNP